MKFKSTNVRTGEQFSCRLKCARCVGRTRAGDRCKNKVCIGKEYCHIHRKTKRGLVVKQSKIKNAGKGLFAVRTFKKGEVIGYYRGELLSTAEHNRRYGSTDDDHAPYSLQASNSKGRIVDASCSRHLMSMANGSRRRSNANARFVDYMRPSDGAVKVQATKTIKKNEEIIIHYGRDYFDTASNAKHSTR